MLYWLYKIFAFIPFWLVYPTFIKGLKNIPKGKCVIVCNHRSDIDPLLLLNLIWREQRCLSKKELFTEHKILRHFLNDMHAIAVDRDRVEMSTIKECLKTLKENKLLTIFPEGTRNKTNEDLLPLKDGAGLFAIKGDAPIIPIWIKKKPKPFCFNKIVIGKPFKLEKEQLEPSSKIIREKMLEIKIK